MPSGQEHSSAPKAYRDKQGRILFVSGGISSGKSWMTCYRKPSGSLKRVVSANLPLRDRRDQAEADLREYATKNGFEEVKGEGGEG